MYKFIKAPEESWNATELANYDLCLKDHSYFYV